MGTTDFLLLVVPASSAILAGIGGAIMLAPSVEHKKSAKIAFAIAGVLFWATGIIWGNSNGDSTMFTRYLIVGIVGAASAITTLWALTLTGVAQTPSIPSPQANTGPTVIQNSGGGTGADISVRGAAGSSSPAVGLETNGLYVIQNGSGVGVKITVGGDGPAVGVRSTVVTPQR